MDTLLVLLALNVLIVLLGGVAYATRYCVLATHSCAVTAKGCVAAAHYCADTTQLCTILV